MIVSPKGDLSPVGQGLSYRSPFFFFSLSSAIIAITFPKKKKKKKKALSSD